MSDWDSLIAEAKNESTAILTPEKLQNGENDREFAFGDAIDDSTQKRVNEAISKAELDPYKMKPATKPEKVETAGENWYNMPKAEMTEELKRDWEILRMRSVLQKGGANAVELPEEPPEFLQVGIIRDNPMEGRKGRVSRKYRAATITEALAKDQGFRDFLESSYMKMKEKKERF